MRAKRVQLEKRRLIGVLKRLVGILERTSVIAAALSMNVGERVKKLAAACAQRAARIAGAAATLRRYASAFRFVVVAEKLGRFVERVLKSVQSFSDATSSIQRSAVIVELSNERRQIVGIGGESPCERAKTRAAPQKRVGRCSAMAAKCDLNGS